MKFPITIRHRKESARIYGKREAYPFYRVSWYASGKRHLRDFSAFSEAKEFAAQTIRQLAEGNLAPVLSVKQTQESMAALDLLAEFNRQATRKLSLASALSDYLAAMRSIGQRSLKECVDGYLATVATIKRMDLAQAVDEFIALRAPKTVSKDGKRPELNPVYHENVKSWLTSFAKTLPGYALCDLTKDLINLHMGKFSDLSTKSRNDRRAALTMFFAWCVKKDYLAPTHRLNESDSMARERVEIEEIAMFTPDHLRLMLENSDGPLRAAIVLGGLGGLRGQEICRLSWSDVWRVQDHIEVSSTKSKTRSRRLVPICDSLRLWLEPFRRCQGEVWPGGKPDTLQNSLGKLRERLNIPDQRNGLRHSFCSYHFGLHSNENLTAAAAGNSPQMIHAHYKGLVTKDEAAKWFATAPAPAAENVLPLHQAKSA